MMLFCNLLIEQPLITMWT